jgi:hypothetical protein
MGKLCAAALILGALLPTGQADAQNPDEVVKLKREIELMRKENELLNREITLLKQEIAQLRAGTKPDPVKPKAGRAGVTTRDDIEYEFVSIKMDGNVGYMKLAITAKKADKVLDTQGIRLIAAEGTEHKAPLMGVINSNGLQTGRLPEGVRTVVEFKIGQVPGEIKEFTTILLPGVYGPNPRERLKNPVVLKGSFKVER